MCISDSIREEFDSPLFEASLAMVITWYGVTYFQGDNDTEVSIGISFSSCWYFKNSFFSPKGPVPYTNATQLSGRVVISRYMGPGVTTTVGSSCTTDPSGRKT